MTQTAGEGTLPASGQLAYQDDYGVIYLVSWRTTASGLDITTVTMDPVIPGRQAAGFTRGHALFREGVVTAERQIIVTADADYTVVSAGATQAVEYFQSSFPCGLPADFGGGVLADKFAHHMNNAVVDSVDALMACGPRWSDPDVAADDVVSWGDVAGDGSVTQSAPQLFQWLDLWPGISGLQSTCV